MTKPNIPQDAPQGNVHPLRKPRRGRGLDDISDAEAELLTPDEVKRLTDGGTLPQGKRGSRFVMVKDVVEWMSDRPDFTGCIRTDLFSDKIMRCELFTGHPLGFKEDDTATRPWSDIDTTRLKLAMNDTGLSPSNEALLEAIAFHADRLAYHSLQDELTACGEEWAADRDDALGRDPRADSFERVRQFLGFYMGVKQGEEWGKFDLIEMSRLMLLGAVKRAFEPGCQFDIVPMLEGRQGLGKTSLVRTMALREEWAMELTGDLGNKDARLDLRGKWLVELPELASVRRSQGEQIKAFVTARVDNVRPHYGRTTQAYRRSSVFWGSTNEGEYLTDATGNRRFWPLKCGEIRGDALRRDMRLIWGEAVVLYFEDRAVGTDRYEPSRELMKIHDRVTADRMESDPWDERLDRFLLGRTQVTTTEFLTEAEGVGMTRDKQGKREEMRVSAMLRKRGWERGSTRLAGIKTRVWKKPETIV